MQAEGDFALTLGRVFDFKRGRVCTIRGKNETVLKDAYDIDALQALRHHHHGARRGLHQRSISKITPVRLDGSLDRRRLDSADEGRRRHHPRPR